MRLSFLPSFVLFSFVAHFFDRFISEDLLQDISIVRTFSTEVFLSRVFLYCQKRLSQYRLSKNRDATVMQHKEDKRSKRLDSLCSASGLMLSVVCCIALIHVDQQLPSLSYDIASMPIYVSTILILAAKQGKLSHKPIVEWHVSHESTNSVVDHPRY